MRAARKSVLLASLVMAITAFSVSTASAVEVIDEYYGTHCSQLTYSDHFGSSNCGFHVSGNTELGTPLGMINCWVSLNGYLGENGQGLFEPSVGSCSPSMVVECNESGFSDNWPIRLTSETTMEVQLCVVAFGFLTVNCHLAGLDFSMSSHVFVTIHNHFHTSCEGGGNSIRGDWSGSSTTGGFEVID